jgi:hypothetical protein
MHQPIQTHDRILYTQALTNAGYVVHALTAIDVLRGGVLLHGAFERDGETVDQIDAAIRGNTWQIGEQRYHVTMLAGGLFQLTEVKP